MTAPRFSCWWAASVAILALSQAGCETSAPPAPYNPYEGINIDSPSLVAPYGCGTGPGQVYRYLGTLTYGPGGPDAGDASDAATVTDGGLGPVVATGVFDCFADGVFSGIPAPANYVLTIDAFTLAESEAAGLACDSEASPCVPPMLDAGTVIPGYSWTTTCTASALAGASPYAQCGELLPVPAANTDAGTDAAVEPGVDSGADGGAIDATIDAGAPTDGASEGGG